MSVIQPILKRLRQDFDVCEPSTAAAGAIDLEPGNPSLRTSKLGCQASWYRENLGQCNEPMLQYEWAWINGRIASLLQVHGAGAEGGSAETRLTGGSGWPESDPQLTELLTRSQLFRTLLLQEFSSRGLTPLPPLGAMVASEEAWEITRTAMRQEWGIL